MSAELRAWAEKLNALQTSNDVRITLAGEGAKGFRGSTVSCVLANFLFEKGGVGLVDVSARGITFQEKHVGFDGGEKSEFQNIPLSSAVRLFVARFDRGEYPELTLYL